MTHYYIIAGIYVAALVVLVVMIFRASPPRGNLWRALLANPVQRTVATLAAVYVVQLAYSYTVGEWGQELAFIVLDATAATVILFRPAGWAQAMIGLTYLLQMSMHAAKAVLTSPWLAAALGLHFNAFDPVVYWWFVTAAAFLQLLLVGGWWFNVRGSYGGDLRGAGPAHGLVHRKGAER